MPEPITFTVEPGPGNRIYRIHEALRDLGLDICPHCSVWRPLSRFDPVATIGPFTMRSCKQCAAGAGDAA